MDPTTAWPVQRTRITAGVLTLDEVVADQLEDQERWSQSPSSGDTSSDMRPS